MLADPDRLERIVVNLVSNALKYSPDDQPVVVSFLERAGRVVVSVADHGEGIPADEVPHLFERYYRSDRTSGQREGIGLGLYITKRLVEAHGGTVQVHSAQGKGTVFSFDLPVAAAPLPDGGTPGNASGTQDSL